MKVLFISEYFPPSAMGGGEISAFLLARALAKEAEITEVHVLTSLFDGLEREEKKEGIFIHRLLKTGHPGSLLGNLARMLLFERSLLRELEVLQKRENFDIIHCMNTNSISAVLLREKTEARFVLHLNGPLLFCPKGTLMYMDREACNKKCTRLTYLDCFFRSRMIGKMNLNPLIKYNPLAFFLIRRKYEHYQQLLKRFDFYMPISPFMEKRLDMAGIDKSRMEIVYNITEHERFRLSLKKNKIKRILYLGEYSQPKGPQVLLEALKKIKEEYEANFYGSGVLKDYLDINKGEKSYVHDKAPYEKIPSIMAEHDILVFPSLVGEAFGRAALEACFCGKTVIASYVGGVPDIIVHGKTGFLFKPGDAEELAGLLRKAIKNPLNPKSVRNSVMKKFSDRGTIERVMGIYKKLITRSGAQYGRPT